MAIMLIILIMKRDAADTCAWAEDDFDAGVVCVVLCMWFLHLVVCMLGYIIPDMIKILRSDCSLPERIPE